MKLSTNSTTKRMSISRLIKMTMMIISIIIVVFFVVLECSTYLIGFIREYYFCESARINTDQRVDLDGLYYYSAMYDLASVSHSRYIQLSLSDEDNYRIEFINGKDMEYIIVSTTNTDRDSYLYLVPAHIRDMGYSQVRVSVLGGDDQYWVSSVHLYDDVDFADFADHDIVDFEIKIIDIDIEYTHLKQLAKHRSNAIARQIILPEDVIYYPAKISSEGKTVNTQIRLKGRQTEHVVTDKWSFRFKVDGDESLFGMQKFAIHRPEARNGVYEYMMHTMYGENGGISLYYDYAQVVVNGEYWGVYAIEQNLDSIVASDSSRPEGVMLSLEKNYLSYRTTYGYINSLPSEVASHLKVYKENKTVHDKSLYLQGQYAIDAYTRALEGDIPLDSLLDFDEYAKYLALCEVFQGNHGLNLTNSYFYLNPITAKLEPISHDMLAIFNTYIPTTISRSNSMARHVFDYPSFVALYSDYLVKFVDDYDSFYSNHRQDIASYSYLLSLDRCIELDYQSELASHHKFIIDTLDSEDSIFVLEELDDGAYYIDVNANSVICVDVEQVLLDGTPLDISFDGRAPAIYLGDSVDADDMERLQIVYTPLFAPDLAPITKDITIQ